jgi:hypothetical protein
MRVKMRDFFVLLCTLVGVFVRGVGYYVSLSI